MLKIFLNINRYVPFASKTAQRLDVRKRIAKRTTTFIALSNQDAALERANRAKKPQPTSATSTARATARTKRISAITWSSVKSATWSTWTKSCTERKTAFLNSKRTAKTDRSFWSAHSRWLNWESWRPFRTIKSICFRSAIRAIGIIGARLNSAKK